MPGTPHETWVFGYGSLMWRPDFPFVERYSASVVGLHRAFCIKSTHYRGTPQRPGLVLGLDRGGRCVGVAYRVAAEDAAAVLAYLRQRELIYGVYREALVTAKLHAGEQSLEVPAVTYIAERLHPAYAGDLPLVVQARVIRAARGRAGDNLDYAINTVRHLEALGIVEPRLHRLLAVSGVIAARGARDMQKRASVAALRVVASRQSAALHAVPRDQLARFTFRARLD